jgi:hypothetical protein
MKSNLLEDKSLYDIPFTVNSHFSVFGNILYTFVIVSFAYLIFLEFSVDLFHNNFLNISYKVFFIILEILFLFYYIYFGVLKKAFICLSENEITIKIWRNTKIMKWSDIPYVEINETGYIACLGIIKKNAIQKSAFKQSRYEFSIPMNIFSTLDADRLCATIMYKVNHVNNLDLLS